MKPYQVLKLAGILLCTLAPLAGVVAFTLSPAVGVGMIFGGLLLGVPVFILGRVMESL